MLLIFAEVSPKTFAKHNAIRVAVPAIAFVRLEDWSALWREIDRRVRRYERWPALYSDVAAYARARHGARLVAASFDDASLGCDLLGEADVPLYLYVWDDLGNSEWVMCRYVEVEPFARSKRVVISHP